MTITKNLKNFFFDRAGVQRLMDENTRRKMSSLGSFVQRKAKSLLRRKKSPSSAGSPPNVHSGDDDASLKKILFAYDPQKKSLVVGPLALNGVGIASTNDPGDIKGPASWSTLRKGVIPKVLEFGGYVGVREMQLPDGTWQRIPITKKLRTRRIPIWLATPEEKSRAVGKDVVHRNGRGITFIIVPLDILTRVRFVKIAARPFMGPAGVLGYAEWRRKVAHDSEAKAA